MAAISPLDRDLLFWEEPPLLFEELADEGGLLSEAEDGVASELSVDCTTSVPALGEVLPPDVVVIFPPFSCPVTGVIRARMEPADWPHPNEYITSGSPTLLDRAYEKQEGASDELVKSLALEGLIDFLGLRNAWVIGDVPGKD